MTLAIHSSNSDEWYTPVYICYAVGDMLGQIDLDPASCEQANSRIQAKHIIGAEHDSLKQDWHAWTKATRPISIYLNPPGGKVGNQSQAFLFWEKLMELRASSSLEHAIVMAFNINQLAITQQSKYHAMTEFPICIPQKRIQFISSGGKKNNPAHNNCIVYVPGTVNHSNRFLDIFKHIGAIVNKY